MKKILAIIAIAAFTFAMPACKSKVSDADIKTSADAALQANAALSGVTAEIANGVATLTGNVADDAAKAAAETAIKGVKGVTSVVNNITVAPPPVIAAESELETAVKDAIKDNPTVTASVSPEGVITLTGEINKADLPKLMQKVNATHPKSVDNKGLTIK
ncbi:MAG: transport-associated protein [Sphingobacteriales bacterium 41-5]|nr:MAG: transport-associated protein [Sphingobacteriales bacterium 41-5]